MLTVFNAIDQIDLPYTRATYLGVLTNSDAIRTVDKYRSLFNGKPR